MAPGPQIVTGLEARIQEALAVAMNYAGCEGDHHRMWVIDQMVRVLTGSPEDYQRWVAAFCNGRDGPNTYEWDVGIPP